MKTGLVQTRLYTGNGITAPFNVPYYLAKIYKDKDGIWTVDLFIPRYLENVIPGTILIEDGILMLRSMHLSWELARQYVFGSL